MGDGITRLTLCRPQARNALTLAQVRGLHDVLDAIAADPQCRVLVLAAQGRGFCAGLDLKAALADEAPESADDWMALQQAYAGLVLKLRALPQPVIAAVQGAAVGFGFGLALAADIRVASESAKFLVGAVKVGLTAGECGISYHLPRLIGAGRAFEIMLTGRPVDAAEALATGLVSHVVAEEALADSAVETARAIAANSPYSVRGTKTLMWENLEAPSLDAAVAAENRAQVTGLLTEDFREGAAAFAEKRRPRFRGR
ncbi:enoyl-CoA hydratase [Sphingosinithalassobacter tenebrarum]|uniref:Enoyl-CoA hydratase n=1 Tax=Stakelama tenebrarum TaxID=2711215 RepID=A0A6G6YAI8_9SPHN|nr:enoyl-CoA hydratase [Sphingosinithalassobacter tenebrarum]